MAHEPGHGGYTGEALFLESQAAGTLPEGGGDADDDYSSIGHTQRVYWRGIADTKNYDASQWSAEEAQFEPSRPLPILELSQYEGETQVPLTQNLQNFYGSLNQYVEGPYQQQLSGETNYGMLDRGVLEPARRNLTEQTLPQISDIYSGGPYGGAYQSGSRRLAQMGAVQDASESESQIRYAAGEAAQDRSLKAASLAPGIAGAYEIELKNNIDNVNRGIQTHFANQGLDVLKFNADMSHLGAELSIAGFNFDVDMAEYEKNQDEMERLTGRSNAAAAKRKNEYVMWASIISSFASCCWILLEGRYGNGVMDEVVRKYRDEKMTDKNNRGYYKLAEVFVPLMRKYPMFKWLIAKTLCDPLVAYGKWYYKRNLWGWVFAPVKSFWMKVFDDLGQETEFIRENGETV